MKSSEAQGLMSDLRHKSQQFLHQVGVILGVTECHQRLL